MGATIDAAAHEQREQSTGHLKALRHLGVAGLGDSQRQVRGTCRMTLTATDGRAHSTMSPAGRG